MARGDVETFRRVVDALFNVRYRLKNLDYFPVETYVPLDDPLRKRRRYQLYDFERMGHAPSIPKISSRSGSTALPVIKQIQRRAVDVVEFTPEHARMQKKLMEELRVEYPGIKVPREKNFVDVGVETNDELILFEIKSDLSPRTVIREALGQILEYAYHPKHTHALPVRLVIVGRSEPSPEDTAYLTRLQQDFGLPLAYRVVTI